MDPELKKLLEIPVPKNEPLANLLAALQIINDHETNKEAPIDEARKYLKRFDIPETTSEKVLGLLVQSWIETIKLDINGEHEAPTGPDGTTGGDLKSKIEDFEKRKTQSQAARDTAKRDVARSIDRKKEIFNEEQQRIQQELERVKLAEEKLRGKKIYATVGKIETEKLNDNQKVLYDKLKSESVDELAEKIKEQLSDEQFKKEGDKEKEIFARSVAVGILSQVNNPTLEHSINSKILDTVGHTDLFENTLENELIETAKRGSVALSLNERSLFLLGRQTVAQMYGNSIAETIYGPENLVIILTANQQPGSSYEINIEAINTNYGSLLTRQERLLNEVQENARPESVIYSRIVSHTEKEESKVMKSKIPESEVDKINAIIEKFGLQNPKPLVFTEFETNPWVTTVLESNNPTTTLAEQTTNNVVSDQKTFSFTKTIINTDNIKGKKSLDSYVEDGLFKLKTITSRQSDSSKMAVIAAVSISAFVALGSAVGGIILIGSLASAGMLGPFVSKFMFFFKSLFKSTLGNILLPIITGNIIILIIFTISLLVINNSAYVVPLSHYPSSLNGGADNPYMLVTKTANPSKLDNSNSNQVVIYTVSVKALKGNMTNLKLVSAECKVIKKDKSNIPCSEDFVGGPTGESITPGNDGVFAFTANYDSKYSDSLIYDTITISGINEAGEEITTSGSASVCVGDCPRGCFEISDENEQWPSGYSSTLAGAVGDLVSKFPEFVDKACSNTPTIKLCYTTKNPSPIGDSLCVNNIYAIHAHNTNGCDINFNQCGVRNDTKDASFILTHEISHHVQKFDGGDMVARHQNSGATSELPLCSYSGTIKNGVKNPYEGSAEANALYATGGTASFSTCSMNFQSQYPRNYSYAQEYMNKP